jgi:sn-glycerol 3-phosphate transport system permease protein
MKWGGGTLVAHFSGSIRPCTNQRCITNTPAMTTIVIGIRQMIGNGDAQTAWHLVMATAILALLPPIAVVLAMQRWFVQGLIEPEK